MIGQNSSAESCKITTFGLSNIVEPRRLASHAPKLELWTLHGIHPLVYPARMNLSPQTRRCRIPVCPYFLLWWTRYSFHSEGPGSFLFDAKVCKNLANWHIVVRFGPGYERGSLAKRCGRTEIPRFIGPSGPAGPDEVSVFWSDHRNGTRRSANVPVAHLSKFQAHIMRGTEWTVLWAGVRRPSVQ